MSQRTHNLIFTAIMIAYLCGLAYAAHAKDRIEDVQIEYTECELRGVGGVGKIVYMPGNRPAGFEDVKEQCWLRKGDIDQETIDYYRMIGVEMDVIE